MWIRGLRDIHYIYYWIDWIRDVMDWLRLVEIRRLPVLSVQRRSMVGLGG